MIPHQLKKMEFRFIKVNLDKSPKEKGWQKDTNYLFDDNGFIENNIYGVATGFGDLLVIDFDNEFIQNEIAPKLPKTFTIKSAGKGLLHKYFICDDPQSFKVLDLNKETLADIQGKGKQIIGPNSQLDNGKKYEIVDDLQIADIKISKIKELFSKYLNIEERVKSINQIETDPICKQIKEQIKIPNLLSEYGIDANKNPTSCPLHSSKGGRCFSYTNDVFHCFHCETKGNIFHLVMALEKIDFIEAKKKLSEKAGITIEPQKFIGTIKLDNYMDNVKLFYKDNPFFYDKSNMFWLWNDKLKKYEMVDDTDMMILIEKVLGLDGQTVNSRVKANYLEAFKRVGRVNIPTNAPIKWIQFKDKAISLESGNTYNITPDFFFTNPIPWSIGEIEETKVMDKLIVEWVGEEYKETAYEIIAYCCYTDYPIHMILCLVGCGRNGKSKFLGLINKFIGNYNVCSTELDTLLDSRFESFKLYKKLVCTMGETNFGIISKTSLLKKLTGQDLIGFEFKQKRPFDDYNYAKIIISSNSLPTSTDTSEGFYRRWLIIDFPNIFPEGKDILETIPDVEYNNLALKVSKTLPKLLNAGKFTKQGTITQRKDKYIMASNPLSFFIKHNCVKSYDKFMRYSELYVNYVKYLDQHKKRKINYKEFNDVLALEGLETVKTSKKVGEEWVNGRFIEGIALSENNVTPVTVVLKSPLHSPIGKRSENFRTSVTSVTNNPIVTEESIEETPQNPKKADMLAIIKELTEKGDKLLNLQEILTESLKIGFTETTFEQMITILLKEGDIYEPKYGFITIL